MSAPSLPDVAWFADLHARLVAIEPDMATDEALLFDTLDGQSEVVEQLRAVVRYGIEADTYADALTARIEALKDRKARFLARYDACREAVRDRMQALEIKKLPAPDFSVSLQDGHARAHLLDVEALPEAYVRVRREPDYIAIAAALKAGHEVPGAELNDSPPFITIRRR